MKRVQQVKSDKVRLREAKKWLQNYRKLQEFLLKNQKDTFDETSERDQVLARHTDEKINISKNLLLLLSEK